MAILEEGCRSHFDPRVLDALVSIALNLYKELAWREDRMLKTALETVIQHYFNTDAAAPKRSCQFQRAVL